MTLISVLKGVAYGWRQEKLVRNADELRRIGAEFIDRLRMFGEAYADSGRHLNRAVEAYNRSSTSWDTRVLPSLRRMSELGAGGTAEPTVIPRLDGAAREPQAVGPAMPDAQVMPPQHIVREPRDTRQSQHELPSA